LDFRVQAREAFKAPTLTLTLIRILGEAALNEAVKSGGDDFDANEFESLKAIIVQVLKFLPTTWVPASSSHGTKRIVEEEEEEEEEEEGKSTPMNSFSRGRASRLRNRQRIVYDEEDDEENDDDRAFIDDNGDDDDDDDDDEDAMGEDDEEAEIRELPCSVLDEDDVDFDIETNEGMSEEDDDDDVREEMKGDYDMSRRGHESYMTHAHRGEFESFAKQLYKMLDAMELPKTNPLDDLINRLGGSSKVAEMSGRKLRLAEDEDGQIHHEKRAKSMGVSQDKLNLIERGEFMSGKKLVAVISEAASCGISLQADRRVGNQRRRVHMTLQLAWSADQTIQQLGRSHRSNQASAPIYRLFVTEMGGERRFAASVSRRLAAMGALMKGDRKAADATDLSAFNYSGTYGTNALKQIIERVALVGSSSLVRYEQAVTSTFAVGNEGERSHLEMKQFLKNCGEQLISVGIDCTNLRVEKKTMPITKFLNRLLGLKCKMQNDLFQYFSDEFDREAAEAKRAGKADEGVVDVQGKVTLVESTAERPNPELMDIDRTCAVGNFKGATTTHTTLSIDQGMSFSEALAMVTKHDKKSELLERGDRVTLLSHGGTYRSKGSSKQSLEAAIWKVDHNTGQAIVIHSGINGESKKNHKEEVEVKDLTPVPHVRWFKTYNQSQFGDQEMGGVSVAILQVSQTDPQGWIDPKYRIFKPGTGTQSGFDVASVLLKKRNVGNGDGGYKWVDNRIRITQDEVEPMWNTQYEALASQCAHGETCARGGYPNCHHGCRHRTLGILAGATLGIH